MAYTLAPAVSGRRKRMWLADTSAFAIGVAIGALVSLMLITAAFLASKAVGSLWIYQAGAVLIIAGAIARDLGAPIPVPYRRGQVPKWLRDALPAPVTAAVFGALLGQGFLTFYTYSGQLAWLLLMPFVERTSQFVVLLMIFILAKSLPAVVGIGAQRAEQVIGPIQPQSTRVAYVRTANVALSAVALLMMVTVLPQW